MSSRPSIEKRPAPGAGKYDTAPPPRKLPKVVVGGSAETGALSSAHPYGVEPLGNVLVDGGDHSVRCSGLGALAALDDECVLEVLEFLLGEDLARLSRASRAAYAFAHHEDLWRALAVGANPPRGIAFSGSWKATVVAAEQSARRGPAAADAAAAAAVVRHVPIQVRGLYSDALFQRWFSYSVGLRPDMLSRDNMERRAAASMSVEEFVRDFEAPGRPVLITGLLAGWHALEAWRDMDALAARAGSDALFVAGPARMTLPQYIAYARGATDDTPLYLFDSKFCERAPVLASDFDVPKYFQQDLFSLLGPDRPDYRWLIVGPARSGAGWHIDPNSTHAWNGVVSGKPLLLLRDAMRACVRAHFFSFTLLLLTRLEKVDNVPAWKSSPGRAS